MLWSIHHLVLIILVGGGQLIYQSAGQPQRKFAPAYCLRFKFNCNNAEKKGHVCCLYPLPENAQQANNQQLASSSGSGLNIRPIRLPVGIRTPTTEGNTEENKKPANKNNNKKNSRPSTRNNNRNTPKPNVNINNRPRICQRLVVNCETSPEHRCCQYQKEEELQNASEVESEEVVEEIEEVEVEDPVKPVKPERPVNAKPAKPERPVNAKPVRNNLPIGANKVKTGAAKPIIVKGEAIPVPLENPAVQSEVEKYEQIINDEVGSIPDSGEPYERIPAECFTEDFDCEVEPSNKCCAFLE